MKETILMQATVCGAAPVVEQAEISEPVSISSRFTYPSRLSRLETLVAKERAAERRQIMNTLKMRWLLMLCALVAISALSAQSSAQYEISWYTIDGGGGTSSGGSYALTGTIGQPDADWSRAGGYELLGGFWPGGPLCFVAFDDFARFADLWLTADPAGDLDGDSDIDLGDLGTLADYWLFSCPYAWPLK